MDFRRASRIAEWTLVAFVGLLHAGIFLCPETRGQQPLIEAAHDAQLLSGIVLALAWCVLGPGWVWLRVAALPVLVGLWLLPWNYRMQPRELSLAFQLTVAGTAAAVLITLRLLGQRVRRLAPAAGPERGAQFSLLGLLIATTLIAAAFGGLEALRPLLVEKQSENLLFWGKPVLGGEPPATAKAAREYVLAVFVALSALGGLWIVARPGAIWFRLGAVLVAIPVVAGYLTNLSGVTDERTTIAVNLGLGLALVAGLMAITVLPLRLMDYRWQRQPKAAAQPALVASDKRRLMARAALTAVALAVLTIGLSSRVPLKVASDLRPPVQTFAKWIDPPHPIIYWLDTGVVYKRQVLLHFQRAVRASDLQASPDGAALFEISNTWEYPMAVLVPDNVKPSAPDSGASSPDEP